MPDFDVLVAGEINPDLILADPDLEPRFGQAETLVEAAELTIGSSSAIFACGAARLGLRVALVGVVGDDLFGRYMLEALRARGVEIGPAVIDPTRSTGFSVILARAEDRAILTYPGAIPTLRADQVPDDLLRASRHLHVGSFFLQTALQPGLPALFTRARSLGLTTSLDTNWDPSGQWARVDELLSLTDLFLPNEAEALALTGASTAESALKELAGRVPTVALKRGRLGALAANQDQRAQAAAPSFPVADTVGAGDSFDAGFVYAFRHGWPLARSLRFAVACGSLSVRAHGGTAAQPTLAEALAQLSPDERP